MNKTIEEYTKEIHQQNVSVGWWDNPDECIYQKIQLISTEICEATEGERKNLMDDHLPTRKMGEVELADALIRTLDLGGKLGLEYDNTANHSDHIDAGYTIGRQHLGITIAVSYFAMAIDEIDMHLAYSQVINSILRCAEINNYSIYEAMDEKITYNKSRPDHKRSTRTLQGGKSF